MGFLAVYTTITYHRFRFLLNAEKWPWYTRIDDRIVVGAVPLKWMLDTLVKRNNVGGVVCCAEEWELKTAGSCGAVQRRDWDAAGVRVHHVPFEKHFLAAVKDVHGAMQFVDDVTAAGKSVYVHSVNGRARAPAIAACYYLYKEGGKGHVALDRIALKRKRTKYAYNHWRTVDNYERYLEEIKGTPAGRPQEASEKSVLQRLVGYVWS